MKNWHRNIYKPFIFTDTSYIYLCQISFIINYGEASLLFILEIENRKEEN